MIPESLAIVVFDNQLSHLVGGHKSHKGANLPRDLLDDLPEQLRSYQAILRHKKTGNIVYVLPGKSGDRNGRAVVQINFRRKGQVFNSVRSLGVVNVRDLGAGYEVLEGNL